MRRCRPAAAASTDSDASSTLAAAPRVSLTATVTYTANTATRVYGSSNGTYSGTVAGAIEATLLGIPAFALSQGDGAGSRDNLHWACAQTHAPGLVRRILDEGFPPEVLINLNFPDCPPEGVAGISVAVQGRRSADLFRIDQRADGRGSPYYWIGFARTPHEPGHGSDLAALHDKRIAVTPLKVNLTDEPTLTRLALLLESP